MLGLSLMKSNNGFKTFLISANAVNINLFTIASAPTVKGKFRFVVANGVVIGHTLAAVAAVIVGQFPAGSELEFYNYGSIQGRGGLGGVYSSTTGTAAGANGGDCIKADYLNQTLKIFNYGEIKSGGGGSGSGGQGGNGGNGGRGDIYATTDWVFFQSGGGGTEWVNHYNTGINDVLWSPYSFRAGTVFPSDGSRILTTIGVLDKGAQVGSGDDFNGLGPYLLHQVRLNYLQAAGAGGGSTAGGKGGDGAGYNQLRTTGSAGIPSTPGQPGGAGAGLGGDGGGAGSGGDGGDWGQSATLGIAGGNGTNGTAGSAGGFTEQGAAGVGGGGPGAVGSGGRYLIKGAAAVTFTNNGTVAGTLA